MGAEISNEVIRIIALQYGFKLKEQPNGEDDLNPYVYTFARKLINMATDQAAAAAPTPPAQDGNNGEDLTTFYILRKPGLVPRVCRPMGDDLAANLRDWFKHHPGATIDIVRVRLIDGRVSDLWVDDGIEYLQILNDGGWIPERPGTSAPPAQEDVIGAYQVKFKNRDVCQWQNTSKSDFEECGRYPDTWETRILYIRPQSDELRKAAKELIETRKNIGNFPIGLSLERAVNNLRVALERK